MQYVLRKIYRCVVNKWNYRTFELNEKEHLSPVDLMITMMLMENSVLEMLERSFLKSAAVSPSLRHMYVFHTIPLFWWEVRSGNANIYLNKVLPQLNFEWAEKWVELHEHYLSVLWGTGYPIYVILGDQPKRRCQNSKQSGICNNIIKYNRIKNTQWGKQSPEPVGDIIRSLKTPVYLVEDLFFDCWTNPS